MIAILLTDIKIFWFLISKFACTICAKISYTLFRVTHIGLSLEYKQAIIAEKKEIIRIMENSLEFYKRSEEIHVTAYKRLLEASTHDDESVRISYQDMMETLCINTQRAKDNQERMQKWINERNGDLQRFTVNPVSAKYELNGYHNWFLSCNKEKRHYGALVKMYSEMNQKILR